MLAETPFLKTSNDVVRAFLSSVVLVDDQAYLVAATEDPQPTKLSSPGRQGGSQTVPSEATTSADRGSDKQASQEISPPTESNTATAPAAAKEIEGAASKRDHTLDGKIVIDVFAKIGVVCAVMRPTKEELGDLPNLLAAVGANSDAVILDWVLHDSKSGEKTLELIERLVKSAADEMRTRLIVVYTAEPDLSDIEEKIRKKLGAGQGLEPLTVVSGGTRICVYGKAGIRPARIGEVRSKTPGELAEVVVAEFSHMTKGLLSNVAMKSIASIRARTFQLLSRFDSDIDAPYVTQSALISPEKAEEQLTSLIVSEIQEILEDDDVAAIADYDGIINWLDDRRANGLALPVSPDLTADEFYAGLKQLIRDGVRKTALTKLKTDHGVFVGKIIVGKDKDKEPMYIRNALTGILRSHPQAPHESDELWTMLMSLRHRYSNPAPMLTLGVVVARQKEDNTEYFLCLQPVCDSVRLKSARPFPLLQLTLASNSKSCDLIVRDGQLKFLQVKPSPYKLEMISFSPNRNEKVMADSDGRYFWFSASENVRYRWVADLKPAHAQRVANNFGHTFSRVGLVESEWNRLGSSF